MNPNLKRSVILEHYQNPKNKGIIQDESYLKINMNNESCIDEITLIMKIEKDIIKDIRFDGEACAISTSSTSIMIDTLIGKSVSDAKIIIKNYYNMIEEKDYDSEVLEQAIVFDDIYLQPNRKKCALISWKAADKILERSK